MANRKVTKDVSDNIIAGAVLASFPLNKLDRILEWASVTTVTIKGSNLIPLRIGDHWFLIDTDTTVSTASDMDTGAISNSADYYVYACDDSGSLVFKISLASTYPSGFTAATSRKIGGFHTLCVAVDHETDLTAWVADTVIAVGESRKATSWDTYIYRCTAIAGDFKTHATTEPVWAGIGVGDTIVDDQVTWIKEEHALEGYAVNSILPQSVWDLKHRPICEPAGMVWSEEAQIWVDIYLASGTGGSTASVNGGTISDTRNWIDFVDDFGAVKKQLLDDSEFQLIAAGSNEETNINGSADPVTTGGHSDTASRRMISDIGCEDCTGALRQWLKDQSYRLDGADFAAAKTWAWYDLPGAKGSLYRQADYGDAKLIAGGHWSNTMYCGSRSRYASYYRWNAAANISGRGRSRKL